MLMGFISLMLLACEDQITWFCMPNALAEWITCDKYDESLTCTAADTTWVAGTPCCTLGDYYWSHLYESTIPLDTRRRMENISAEEAMLEDAHEIMGEAFTHRRLGAVNRHNSLLRTTCPSRKFTTDIDSYGEAVMPPAVHAFDCPANGHLVYLPPTGDADYVPTRDPDTGFRSGLQGGSADEVGGFTSSSFMDPQALHHVHTLIFLTACYHVVFTVLVMVMSQWRIMKWQEWEFYGDAEDGSETVDKLRSPRKHTRNPPVAPVICRSSLTYGLWLQCQSQTRSWRWLRISRISSSKRSTRTLTSRSVAITSSATTCRGTLSLTRSCSTHRIRTLRSLSASNPGCGAC